MTFISVNEWMTVISDVFELQICTLLNNVYIRPVISDVYTIEWHLKLLINNGFSETWKNVHMFQTESEFIYWKLNIIRNTETTTNNY